MFNTKGLEHIMKSNESVQRVPYEGVIDTKEDEDERVDSECYGQLNDFDVIPQGCDENDYSFKNEGDTS